MAPHFSKAGTVAIFLTLLHWAAEADESVVSTSDTEETSTASQKVLEEVIESYLEDLHKLMGAEKANKAKSGNSDVELIDGSPTGRSDHQWNRSKNKETEYFYVVSPPMKSPKQNEDLTQVENAVDVEDVTTRRSPPPRKTTQPSTTEAVIVPNPEFIRSKTLHPITAPTAAFRIMSNKTLYRFEVDPAHRRMYFISVVVEKMKMKCSKKRFKNGKSPKLYIGDGKRETYLCDEIDNVINSFQAVTSVMDGFTHVNVTGVGNWPGDFYAYLVASIYYETSHCYYCTSHDHFCCGKKSGACRKETSTKDASKDLEHAKASRAPEDRYRCIPMRHGPNGSSLLCNGHANCGLHCNLDELQDSCPKDEDDDSGDCTGYYCRDFQSDRYLLTLLLLVVFCLLIPFCMFVIFCSRRELRTDFSRRGRCPLPLEIIFCPFSLNADPEPPRPPPPRRHRRRPHHHRQQRHSEEVVAGSRPPPPPVEGGVANLGYFDDLPPPYSECCHDKEMYPNPPKYDPTPSDDISQGSWSGEAPVAYHQIGNCIALQTVSTDIPLQVAEMKGNKVRKPMNQETGDTVEVEISLDASVAVVEGFENGHHVSAEVIGVHTELGENPRSEESDSTINDRVTV